jgi:hypothetical protein
MKPPAPHWPVREVLPQSAPVRFQPLGVDAITTT